MLFPLVPKPELGNKGNIWDAEGESVLSLRDPANVGRATQRVPQLQEASTRRLPCPQLKRKHIGAEITHGGSELAFVVVLLG